VVRVVGAAKLEDDEMEVVLTDEEDEDDEDELEVVLVWVLLAVTELAAEEPVAELLDEVLPPEIWKGNEYCKMLGSESRVISMP
jgi:hypothetical protein